MKSQIMATNGILLETESLLERCDNYSLWGSNMEEGMLLAAIGCSRLPGMFDIAARHPFVVFGTMDGYVLAGLANCVGDDTAPALPVYFYETG